MKLIFAQGNPGAQYTRTRHNVGFLALDEIAHSKGATWQIQSKFNAEIASFINNGEKVLLVKPLSFYNDTGLVARSLTDFYKLNPSRDLLVIHDELALPFGTIRIRHSGSDAGNNGIKSLNSHLGEGYTRMRIGIYNERRDIMADADFVLSVFSSEESSQLQNLIKDKVKPLIEDFLNNQLEASSHKIAKG